MSLFNEEQRTRMAYLDSLPLEQRCYCGWATLGSCYNGNTLQGKHFCHPTKTRADHVAELEEGRKYSCIYCHAIPGELCQNAVADMPWGNHNERGMKNIIALNRENDNTVYGYKCMLCGGHWKVYQKVYHTSPCTDKEEKHCNHRTDEEATKCDNCSYE